MDLEQVFKSPQLTRNGSDFEGSATTSGCNGTTAKKNKNENKRISYYSSSTNGSSLITGVKRRLNDLRQLKPKSPKITSETRHDDLKESLEAITTPKLSVESGKQPQLPLSPVDQNVFSVPLGTENSTEQIDAAFRSSKNIVRKKLHPAQIGTTTITKTKKRCSFAQRSRKQIEGDSLVKQYKTCKAHYNQTSLKRNSLLLDQNLGHNSYSHYESHQKQNEDEFGELDLSDDDLAKIDSMAHAVSSRRLSKRFAVEHATRRGNVSTSVTDVIDQHFRKVDEISHCASIKETSDEFGDFLSDVDFAEIDAVVLTKSSVVQNAEAAACRAKPAPRPQETIPLEVPASSMDTSSTSYENKKQNDEKIEREGEDEFGCLPSEDDFSRIDAWVATQRCPSKSADSKVMERAISPSHLDEVKDHQSSLDKKSELSKVRNEFSPFPNKTDFHVLDQVSTQKEGRGPSFEIDLSTAIRNKKANRCHRDEPSFMKFSRYMVLAVDYDQRNSAKILKVASWINSMAESDRLIEKVLKDGRVKQSAFNFPGGVNSCIFTAAQNTDYPEDGLLYLCGEWSFTPVKPGDIVHVCSLTGQYETDVTALPIVLHSFPPPGSAFDDLILVLHPDMLMSPSIVSEMSSCSRRAALKSKIGSTGISSKSAFIGTMRHALFEACMKAAEFDLFFAQRTTKKLVREKAEMLIGCNFSESEAEDEVLGILPMLKQFSRNYTTLKKDTTALPSLGKPVKGVACHPDIHLLIRGVHSVEENIISTPLGLKGSIDAVLEIESTAIRNQKNNLLSTNKLYHSIDPIPHHSLMCLELKTGHNQNIQNAHLAQLSLYTSMLQSQYGAHVEVDGNLDKAVQTPQKSSVTVSAPGGILLYLNDKSQQIRHISFRMNELKTLVSQRNVVASDSKHALRPKGITLTFEETNRKEDEVHLKAKLLPAQIADLPELKTNSHSCKRCFSNRECMLYAASDSAANLENHRDLLSQFTGHLKGEDLVYFRKWDRLIDIEAQSSKTKASTPWLLNTRTREIESGKSISGMTFDEDLSFEVGTSKALVCLSCTNKRPYKFSIESFDIAEGANVVLSTDGTLLDHLTQTTPSERLLRSRILVMKGCIDRIEHDKVYISTTSDALSEIKLLVSRCQGSVHRSIEGNSTPDCLLFRLDKTNSSVGTGILRWNLINFLTGDHTARTKTECSEFDQIKQRRLAWLRDVVIRLKPPQFVEEPESFMFSGIDLHIPGCNLRKLSEEFLLLNDAQQKAVRKVMSSRDYTLIQGLPGTGKTSTLGFLARLFVARGQRVLITAYTHSAVDNILSKLIEKGMGFRNSKSGMSALVRLGNSRLCHESLKPILHSELALELDKIVKNMDSDMVSIHGAPDNPSAESLKEVITSSRVLGVSALSLPRSPLLQSEIFDVVIVDEAGQMNEPTTLGALAAANSFVLVGDCKQLPPLVNSSIADKGGYGISMLKRLTDQHRHAIAPLTIQYRMNETICEISSESMYGGQLRCGDDKVASQLLKLSGFPSSLPMPVSKRCMAWLGLIVNPEQPVVFVDTDNITERSYTKQSNSPEKKKFMALEGKVGGNVVNRTEAKLVCHIVEAMQMCGHDISKIGVISPFRAQLRVLEDDPVLIPLKQKGLELSTIDKYQGRDKSTIIISFVRSNNKYIAGRLLQDARRLNVAFTRAKCKLIVIGSYQTLSNGSAPLRPILNRMDKRKQRLKLPDNAMNCY